MITFRKAIILKLETDFILNHIVTVRLFVKVVPLKSEHYLYAQDLLGSLNYSLHSLDSLHLAIAASEDILLITADQGLAKAAKKIKAKNFLLST